MVGLYRCEIAPAPQNLTFTYGWDGSSIQVRHSGLMPDTTYNVKVLPRILSLKGYPMRGSTAVEWNFTTGINSDAWSVFSSLITIHPNKNWTVKAVAPKGQELFFVVKGIGSPKLMESARTNDTSYYSGSLKGSQFNWSTLYFFHYSDRDGGRDMAVEFSGYRMMPAENITPPIEWKLFGAAVKLDDDGNWLVNATGNANISVFIVIDGIGSFLLGQVSPGVYKLTIPASNFKGDTEYRYRFSNVSGGNDLAPTLAGTLRTLPVESGGDGDGSLWWVCLLFLGALLLILALAVFVFSMKKKPEAGAEKWGEEE